MQNALFFGGVIKNKALQFDSYNRYLKIENFILHFSVILLNFTAYLIYTYIRVFSVKLGT